MSHSPQPSGCVNAAVAALTESQKAYLAGLIDGEGCVCLSRSKHRQRGTFCYTATVAVAMTMAAELEAVGKETGLGGWFWKYNRSRPSARPCRVWMLGANACRLFLPAILPYLRVKRRQAEILLEYLDLASHKSTKNPGQRQAYHSRVEPLYLEIRALNKKGRAR